jgi:hypothetical protein
MRLLFPEEGSSNWEVVECTQTVEDEERRCCSTQTVEEEERMCCSTQPVVEGSV